MKHVLKERDRFKDKDTAGAITTISDDLLVLESELDGNDDEVLNKINRNILFVNEYLGIKKNTVKNKPKKSPSPENVVVKKQRKLKEFSVEESLAKERELRAKNLLPEIKSKYQSINKEIKSNTLKKDIGVFNKYEYLSKRENSLSPNYMERHYKPLTVKKELKGSSLKVANNNILKNINHINNKKHGDDSTLSEDEDKLMEAEIEYDYETTSNRNYEILLKREKQLEKINKRVLQNIQENEGIYSKKIEVMELTLKHNQEKLMALQNENELLSTEIKDMKKIIKLSKEENKIMNEIKDSKIKIIKDNNISQTRNEILQDLNILKSEESYTYAAGHEIMKSLHKNSNSTSLNNSENADNTQYEEEEEGNQEDSNASREIEEEEFKGKYTNLKAIKTNDIVI